MDPWERCFREGFGPSLTTPELKALARGLRADYVRLVQGATTIPRPLPCVQDWPVEGACALTYARWQGTGLPSVDGAHEAFAAICRDADDRLQEPAGCRYFLNWFDEGPREEVRRELLAVVEDVLRQRDLRVGEFPTGKGVSV